MIEFEILSYVLVPVLLLALASIFSVWLSKKSDHVGYGGEDLLERTFPVSNYFWVFICGFLCIGIFIAVNARSPQGDLLWDLVAIIAFTFAAISIPAIKLGKDAHIQFNQENIIYNTGYKEYRFQRKDVIHCHVDSFGLIKVSLSYNPSNPVVLPPVFKNLPLLIAMLKASCR